MHRVCSIFAQGMNFVPRAEFVAVVQPHRAERHARGLEC